MDMSGFFKKPLIELEKGGRSPKVAALEGDGELTKECPKCRKNTPVSELWEAYNVCSCGYHFRMNARQRIHFIADSDSFSEMYADMESSNLIDFPGYEKKLESARLSSGEKEAVICGTALVGGCKCALFVMEPYFMMGSMGTVVGEKITRIFEYAMDNNLPVIGYTVSGGARMQEGILSLMQMAKTSGAVKRFSDSGGLYITILTDPTTGGVTASFAMEGDIIISEPGATIGFAGARVIEQTIRRKLPDGFQKAEFTMEHGFIDILSPRKEQKELITNLLKIHCAERMEQNGIGI